MRHNACKVGMTCLLGGFDNDGEVCTISYIYVQPEGDCDDGSVRVKMKDGTERIVDCSNIRLKPWTVGDLVKSLEGLPRDFLVESEGCDCIGDVAGLEVDNEEKSIRLMRADSLDS